MAAPALGASVLTPSGSAPASVDPLTTGAITSTASGSSFLIYFATTSSATISTVSDSKSNSYTSQASIVETNDGTKLWVYKTENGTGGSSHTATVDLSSGGILWVALVEVTGGATSSIIDVSATAYNFNDPHDCAVTTTVADTLLIAAVHTSQGVGGAYTAGGSFTNFLTEATTGLNAIASRTGATATSYDPAWTNGSSYIANARITLAIKPAAGGGGGKPAYAYAQQ